MILRSDKTVCATCPCRHVGPHLQDEPTSTQHLPRRPNLRGQVPFLQPKPDACQEDCAFKSGTRLPRKSGRISIRPRNSSLPRLQMALSVGGAVHCRGRHGPSWPFCPPRLRGSCTNTKGKLAEFVAGETLTGLADAEGVRLRMDFLRWNSRSTEYFRRRCPRFRLGPQEVGATKQQFSLAGAWGVYGPLARGTHSPSGRQSRV